MADRFDVMIIGSGPGGYVAAIRAAQLGLKTACVERAELGGICLNWGCIPTKALLHSASLYNELKNSERFGIKAEKIDIDFKGIVKHSRVTATRLSKGVDYLFRKNGVVKIIGSGKIAGKGRVEVAEKGGSKEVYDTEYIIIATGARPRAIPGIEFDGEKIITSKEAMTLKQQPENLIIIGAGAIGVEFAYFYQSIGTKVTLIEMMPTILPIEDEEIVDVVAKSFKKMGISILTETRVDGIEKTDNGVQVKVTTNGTEKSIEGDIALVAIGVQGNIENIGLEEMGIKTEKSFIVVDKNNYQTNVEGIYAIGDIIGPPWLAHVASAEGIATVEGIAGHEPHGVDYNNIPGCTYCQPQVASLGLTEKQAKEAGYDVRVGRFPFRANGKSLAMGHSDGFAKLIFDSKYGELLGAHIVGAEATELLAELGVARTLETTADEIMGTVHAHPTLSEVIKEAAENAYDKAIHI